MFIMKASANSTNTWNEEKGEGIYQIAGEIDFLSVLLSFLSISYKSIWEQSSYMVDAFVSNCEIWNVELE